LMFHQQRRRVRHIEGGFSSNTETALLAGPADVPRRDTPPAASSSRRRWTG
jgi:hypothetical protein